MPEAQDAPARSEKLSVLVKTAFSAHGLFAGAMMTVVAIYLGKFYIDVVLLPAGLFAIAIALGRSIDALTDPVMGWVTDHTNTRWGRRKPWILLGVCCNAIIFYQLLTPSEDLSPAGVMWWFMVCYITSFLCVTIVHVPRLALGAELTLDTRERSLLFGYYTMFGGFGAMIGLGGNFGFAQVTETERELMQLQTAVYVTGYVLLNLWLLHVVPERREYRGRGETPFVPGVRRALRNKPFLIMFTSSIVTAIPVMMPASLVPFFVEYVIKPDDPKKWTIFFGVAFVAPGFVALPFWIWLMRRKGKLFVWLLNGGIGVTGGAALFTCGEGDEILALAILSYVGLQSTVWSVLSQAMHADVIDYDELQTGKRREGQFSSLWSIIPKFAMIPGAAIPLAVLGGMGYVPNEPDQAPEVVLTLSILFALAPACFNLIGLSIMAWYPLSERNHRLIRLGVEKHARGEDATDPITGKTLPPAGGREVDEDTAWSLDFFSGRELRAWVAHGRTPLLSVWAWVAGCILLMGAAASFAVDGIESFDADPGPMPTMAIVVAGLSLTAALFHALRIRPAAKMSVDRKVVQQHLESLR